MSPMSKQETPEIPQLRRKERFGIWLLTVLLRTTALTSRVVVRNMEVAEAVEATEDIILMVELVEQLQHMHIGVDLY